MTRILLLRHGQSTWNALGRWQGRSDPPLSPTGDVQARMAATALAAGALGGMAIRAVVASDLQRARRTADCLALELACGPVEVLAGLRERDVGAFTGLTGEEIELRWPGILSTTPLDPPDAEPRDAVLDRGLTSLRWIATRYPGATVLAVTHGAMIRTVEAHLGVTRPGPPRHLAGRWVHVASDTLRAGPDVSLLPPAVPAAPAISAAAS